MDGNGRWAEAPRPAAPCRSQEGVRAGAAVHRGVRAPRRRRAHAVRVLERELAAAGRSKSAGSCSCSSTRCDREVDGAAPEQGAAALHRRPHVSRASNCKRAWRPAEAAHRATTAGLKLLIAVELRRPLGHRAGRARARARPSRAAASPRTRSTRRASRASSRWATCRIPTCSSAPAAICASAISCCGISPTPSSTSATRCGRTSTSRRCEAALDAFRRARTALRPHATAGRGEGCAPCLSSASSPPLLLVAVLAGVMLGLPPIGTVVAADGADPGRRLGVGRLHRQRCADAARAVHGHRRRSRWPPCSGCTPSFRDSCGVTMGVAMAWWFGAFLWICFAPAQRDAHRRRRRGIARARARAGSRCVYITLATNDTVLGDVHARAGLGRRHRRVSSRAAGSARVPLAPRVSPEARPGKA